MGNEVLKNSLKSVRRFQSQLKASLLLIFIGVLIIAGAVVYYRRNHRMGEVLLTAVSDVSIGSLEQTKPATSSASEKTKQAMTKKVVAVENYASGQFVVKPIAKKSYTSKMKMQARSARVVYQTYRVKKGDTLWKIALQHYHNGHRWTQIYRLNHRAIGSNPHRIFVGTRLVLLRR